MIGKPKDSGLLGTRRVPSNACLSLFSKYAKNEQSPFCVRERPSREQRGSKRDVNTRNVYFDGLGS